MPNLNKGGRVAVHSNSHLRNSPGKKVFKQVNQQPITAELKKFRKVNKQPITAQYKMLRKVIKQTITAELKY